MLEYIKAELGFNLDHVILLHRRLRSRPFKVMKVNFFGVNFCHHLIFFKLPHRQSAELTVEEIKVCRSNSPLRGRSSSRDRLRWRRDILAFREEVLIYSYYTNNTSEESNLLLVRLEDFNCKSLTSPRTIITITSSKPLWKLEKPMQLTGRWGKIFVWDSKIDGEAMRIDPG